MNFSLLGLIELDFGKKLNAEGKGVSTTDGQMDTDGEGNT
jgi:hypothetical protein